MAIYQEIERSIREMILGTEFEPGDQIPSERDLSDTFHASRMTVRRAVETLIAQGFLERRSTSGTFVRQASVVRPLWPTVVQSLSHQITEMGGEAGSRLIEFKEIPASPRVAENLQLPIGSDVFFLHRLRTINWLPFCIERSYLPAGMFPGFTAEEAAEKTSLYQLLKDRYGIQPGRSDDRLSISYATFEEAELLQIREGEAVLYFRSIVFDQDDTPFEYVKSINHAQRVVFESSTENSEKDKK